MAVRFDEPNLIPLIPSTSKDFLWELVFPVFPKVVPILELGRLLNSFYV